MKRSKVALSLLALAVASVALAEGGFKQIKEFLTGYEEVPSVSTGASARFDARISNDESQIQWELSYTNLEGDVSQSHIHFGNAGTNGGISVFLCTNLGNGPAGIQPCPPAPATISGTIVAADVSPAIPATQAARTQGIDTGELDELIAAMRAGATYVNVHSTVWPGGEVRSQIDGRNNLNHAKAKTTAAE